MVPLLAAFMTRVSTWRPINSNQLLRLVNLFSMSYKTANEVKSDFQDIYHAPTPHAYFHEMQRLEYEIGEQAKPYIQAAARLMHRQLGLKGPLRLLDLGCSYGVGAALLKYDFSFRELADFFAEEAPHDYADCIERTQELVAATEVEPVIECAGADASKEAIQFAAESGLIEAGITKNLEDHDRLDAEDVATLRQCHMLSSTGAIGYVGEKTLTPVLQHLGKSLQLNHGPYTVVTILRMFDPRLIERTFAQCGYGFVRVPGVRLRQRQFDGDREYSRTLELLHQRGVEAKGWEAEGHLYADLFAGAPQNELMALVDCLQRVGQPKAIAPVSVR